jgi:hypothetical protein
MLFARQERVPNAESSAIRQEVHSGLLTRPGQNRFTRYHYPEFIIHHSSFIIHI